MSLNLKDTLYVAKKGLFPKSRTWKSCHSILLCPNNEAIKILKEYSLEGKTDH
jgi:hypothetical protein